MQRFSYIFTIAVLLIGGQSVSIANSSLAPNRGMMRRGMPAKTAAMSPQDMAKWQRYLKRRGVDVKYNQDKMLNSLGDDIEALYNPNNKTIFLRNNPSKSAFLEEAFHARQHIRGLPDDMIYNGRIIDRWEFEAQRSLIQNRNRLGIPNEQTRQTIDNLRDVYDGNY